LGSLILALTVGFLLGILLMILLVAGREEEKLLERVEQAESSRDASPQPPEDLGEPVGKTPGERIQKGEA
jgi:hypothetical protein